MAKANATGGIKIRKADSETSTKRIIGLEESTFTGRDGKPATSLAVTVDGVRVPGLSFMAGKWQTLLALFADNGADVIREWVKSQGK